MNSIRSILAAAAVVLCALPVLATRPQFWQAATFEEFSDGRVTGLSITAEGRLILAPEFKEIADSGEPYILSAVRDQAGNIYFGTGHDGKIFRLDPRGAMTLVFDATELDIFALAVSVDGTLYAAGSPGGKLYRMTLGGKMEPYIDLNCKYVWSLAVDGKGVLYAGTGVEGKIYKIKDGKIELFYAGNQVHIMSLAIDLDGNIIAGTAPGAYVLRLSPAGKAQSLFDAPHQEIHQLAVDRYGLIYALGVGVEPPEEKTVTGGEATDELPIFQPPAGKKKGKGTAGDDALDLTGMGKGGKAAVAALYRIDRELNVLPLWASSDTKAFSFAVDADGSIILGTGDKGRLLSIRRDRFYATLVESGQEQATALLKDGENFLALTSNLGKVYRLGSALASRGEFLSDVSDTAIMSRFGAIRASVSPKPGAAYELYFRCGNSRQPDNTWTEWTGPYSSSGKDVITTPPGRYFQVKAVVIPDGRSNNSSTDAWVEELKVAFLQQNQAPRVTFITVNPPGVIFQEQPGMAVPTGIPSFGDHSSLALPDYILAGITRLSMTAQTTKVYRPGNCSLTWTAVDPNDDILEFTVSARKAGSEVWTRLADNIRATYLNIGPNILEDGIYFFRISASDASANPAGQAKEDSLTSRLMVMDGTPPEIRITPLQKSTGGFAVDVEVTDRLSPIYLAEYSTDGGNTWKSVLPEDHLHDQPREVYHLASLAMTAGSKILLFRAMDNCGNVAVASVEAQ